MTEYATPLAELVIIYLLVGMFISTILSWRFLFSKEYKCNWELFIGSFLTWPFTLIHLFRRNNP